MENRSKFTKSFVTWIFLAAFIGIALTIRIAPLYDKVFWGDVIKFSEFDPWYYMRLVDSLVHNFPTLIKFDPYTFFPHGQEVFWHPFYVFLISFVSLVVGAGSPDERVINLVGVYLPPILGALTVIPVFFIGKVLFNRWAGIIAAALIAIMPGEFLNRSLLGFTDHHSAETLFIIVTLLFVMLAIKHGKQKNLRLASIQGKGYTVVSKPLVYSIVAGIFFGLYVLTWVAGLLFLFFLFLYFVIQFVIDHLRGLSTQYLGIIGFLFFLVSAVITLPFLSDSAYQLLYILAFIVAVLSPTVLAWFSWFMLRRKVKAIAYPLAIIIVGALALIILFVVQPSLFRYILERFSIFIPNSAKLTISEVQPIFSSQGEFSFNAVLNNFSLDFFLSFIALGFLIPALVKRDTPETTLLVLWTLYVFIAMVAQSRFAYYFAINVAILTAYLAWLLLKRFGLRDEPATLTIDSKPNQKSKRKEKRKTQAITAVRRGNIILGTVIVVLLCFYPLTGPLPKVGPWSNEGIPIANTVKSATFISDAWYKALIWLRNNTPDPFAEPDFYYKSYTSPKRGEDYSYPDSAYGVATWWDYGHMVTRIAHRIPLSNPHQMGAREVARLFIGQSEAMTNDTMDRLKVRYIVIDVPTVTTKFRGVIAFSGKESEEFFARYYKVEGGKLRGDFYFYPEYYQSLVVRLHNFDGARVVPQSTTVITYQEKVFPEGDPYKEITEIKVFSLYEQATDYVGRGKPGTMRIVGTDPYVSPVPLEPLSKYALIYTSSELIPQPQVGKIPELKIFEYKK